MNYMVAFIGPKKIDTRIMNQNQLEALSRNLKIETFDLIRGLEPSFVVKPIKGNEIPNIPKQEKIKVKSITIKRAEGPANLCGKTYKFNSFEKANYHISKQELSYPKLGYDKHDVKVEWEDSTTYQLRLDCQHPENKYYLSNNCNRIDAHIQNAINYYASDKGSNSNSNSETVQFYKELSDKYEIETEIKQPN